MVFYECERSFKESEIGFKVWIFKNPTAVSNRGFLGNCKRFQSLFFKIWNGFRGLNFYESEKDFKAWVLRIGKWFLRFWKRLWIWKRFQSLDFLEPESGFKVIKGVSDPGFLGIWKSSSSLNFKEPKRDFKACCFKNLKRDSETGFLRNRKGF